MTWQVRAFPESETTGFTLPSSSLVHYHILALPRGAPAMGERLVTTAARRNRLGALASRQPRRRGRLVRRTIAHDEENNASRN